MVGACLIAGVPATPVSAADGTTGPASTSAIVLGVGANAAQRIVSWYTTAPTAQVVQIAPTHCLVDGQFPAMSRTVPATIAANSVNGGYNANAVIDGLWQYTAYSYRVGSEGNWSPTYSFKTRGFWGDFDFLFFGDPQIGSSGNLAKDTAGWSETLNVALTANPDAELLVSAGDQVEAANSEPLWDGLLTPDALRQYPWVATVGNHDAGGKAFEQHHWTPNTDRSAVLYPGDPATRSGGDYWFTYKGVLFIDLSSTAYANGANAAHIAFVTKVVNEHGADAKHIIVIYHHSIYSPAAHANDSDAQQRRQDFPPVFSKLGVDLVLQGHDHSYSRSYVIDNGQKADQTEQPGAANVARSPGGVIYLTADTASGAKYYSLTTPQATRNYGPDPLGSSRHWPNSVENQENVRSYVRVGVRGDQLLIEDVRAGTCAAPNPGVELGRVSRCGPDNGTSPALPVGSTIDRVVVDASTGSAGNG